jgi:NitT/TauT family transport system ATP-binding protein
VKAKQVPAISLNQVSKIYCEDRSETIAIDNLSFAVNEGEIVAIVGPSGAGKTTIINLIAGFIAPTGGTIKLNASDDRTPHRCAVVFQSDALFPWMTVSANIGFSLRHRGIAQDKREEAISTYLSKIGLESEANSWPRQLSGGMRKRVELARAFASGSVLLLDEPFGSLDSLTREAMQDVLLDTWARERRTILFVTHDAEEALFCSQRVVVLTPRPGTVRTILEVPFGDEREQDLKTSPEFVTLRRELLSVLRGNHHADRHVLDSDGLRA